jgi:hypothetical protein
MRSLPHITIACGAIWAGSRLLRVAKPHRALVNGPGKTNSPNIGQVGVAERIDYRLVAVGSLLPDLVDRTQRAVFRVRRSSPDKRLVGHTLLFNLALLITGIYVWRRHGERRLLPVSAAAITHLLVDPVIRSPGTLLWPLLGLKFPVARGLSPRLTAVTQIAAATAAAMTILELQRRNRLGDFIKSGRL